MYRGLIRFSPLASRLRAPSGASRVRFPGWGLA
nr:MAG TPA: hypothetical protein [Caudoviricetes sp.]DAQ67876.1 MAG TPA: hypothetical protein [Caudoviricetes sp.]